MEEVFPWTGHTPPFVRRYRGTWGDFGLIGMVFYHKLRRSFGQPLGTKCYGIESESTESQTETKIWDIKCDLLLIHGDPPSVRVTEGLLEFISLV